MDLKTQEDIDEDVVYGNDTVIYERERKKLQYSMLSIVFRDHFKRQITEDEVPLWRTNAVWCCPKVFCPVPSNEQCDVCVRLCFNKELREKPIRTIDWFHDDDMDSAV